MIVIFPKLLILLKNQLVRNIYIGFGVIQILFIYYLSLRSFTDAPMFFPYQDKVIHLGIYFYLGLYWKMIMKRDLYLFLGLFCMGLSIEFLQMLIPWRSFELLDLFANITGGGFSLLIFRKLKPSYGEI